MVEKSPFLKVLNITHVTIVSLVPAVFHLVWVDEFQCTTETLKSCRMQRVPVAFLLAFFRKWSRSPLFPWHFPLSATHASETVTGHPCHL